MSNKFKCLARNISGGGSSIADNLISYWKMDETGTSTRVDELGTNSLTASLTTNVTGILNDAASAAGTGALFHVDDPSQTPAGSFSIAGWMLIHNLSGGSGLHELLNKYTSAGNQQAFHIGFFNGGPTWVFYCSANGSTGVSATVTHTPTIETWYHVACVYDNVGHTISIRVNDGAVGTDTQSFTGPIFTSTASLVSLLFDNSVGSYAAVDELGFWDRALDSGEITTLYGGGSPPAYPF